MVRKEAIKGAPIVDNPYVSYFELSEANRRRVLNEASKFNYVFAGKQFNVYNKILLRFYRC